jgi:hypothetical protein
VSDAATVHVFDFRGEPCELEGHRWSRHAKRDPAALRGVVLHHWGTAVGVTPENRNRFGEAQALARRGKRVPYDISVGVTTAGEGVVSFAHPLERYLFASDAGNRHYLSVGVMGLFPFEEKGRTSRHCVMSDALVAAVDAALCHAVMLLHTHAGDPAEAGPWSLLAHRQCINGKGDHATCPGEAVIAAALRSKPVADGLLVADPDLVLVPEFGRPWPDAWRRHLPAPRQTALCLSPPDDV